MAPGISTWWETDFLLEKSCSPDNTQFSGKSFIRTWLPGEAVVLLSWRRAMPSQWPWFILNVTALKCHQLGALLDTLCVNQLSLVCFSGTTGIWTCCKSTPLCWAFIPNRKGGKKSQHCKAQEVFCRSSHQLLSVRAAPLLLPTISHSKNQSQAPCTTSKNPLKEEFDDTAGKSPGWHRPLLVLMHLHSLIISEILLEQPMPKRAFNQAPAPGGSHCTSLCKREWRTVDENGAGEAEMASRILPLREGCSQCPLYP